MKRTMLLLAMIEDRKEYMTKWREANRESIRKYNNNWMKHYRLRNPEYTKEQASKYAEYKRNWSKQKYTEKDYRDHILTTGKNWRASHKEYLADWYRRYDSTHKEQHRAHEHTRRAKKFGNGGSYSPEDVEQLLTDQNHRCFYCAASLLDGSSAKYHVEHKTPLSRGGPNNIENIVVSCPLCNRTKGTKTAEEFRKLKGEKN